MKQKKLTKEQKKVIDEAHAFMQMYLAGWIDGFIFCVKQQKKCFITTDKIIWDTHKQDIQKCFEFRFAEKLQGKIKIKNGA